MKSISVILLSSLFSILSLNAQIEVKGTVTDEENYPLIGVTITEKGTTNGTTTDIDGNYTIIVAENATLVYSYIGYLTKELPAKTELNVQMTLSNLVLDEVVVATRSVKRKLRGKVAGVVIRNNNDNSGSNIMIRGTSPKNFEGNVYQEINENTFSQTIQEPLSTFSIDVDRASYSNIRAHIQNGVLPPKNAIRIEEMINYFKYDYPQPEIGSSIKIISETAACNWEPEHRLMMVALQGKEYPFEELPPSNLVFLLDVSGSMSSNNKLPLLQQSFRFLVEQLRDIDKVSIVVYAGSSGVVLPPTSGNEKFTIQKAIDQLQASGSTAGAKGIELAYKLAEKNFIKDGNNRVILATDGDFNVGINSDKELVKLIEKKRESGVFLTVIGVGEGNYMEGKMQQLAQAGNGNHMFIDNIMEAKKVFSTEFGATNFTIAKDVKLQIEFNPKNVAAYRLIGYENRLLENEDFIDDKKDAGEIGSGHTVTAIYEIIPVGVKSKFVSEEIPLKYTNKNVSMIESLNQELATIKIRYKQPNESKSNALIETVENNISNTTDINFQWANLVAEFGLYLKKSEYLPENHNLKQLIKEGKEIYSLIENPTPEHSQFIDLMMEVSKIKPTSMIK